MRHLAIALAAVMLAGLGAVAPASAPTTDASTSGVKVAIIVGATHGATSTYRSHADTLYAEAIKYSNNVVKVYSPNATWSAVRAAVNGASIIVYLGHGNGWPSPYTWDPKYTTKNGFGLNSAAGQGDNNNKYYGEPYIEQLTPAQNAVVLLFHLCYAAGNSEPGHADPTLSVARQRVDNYAAAFLKTGARAVIADGHSHSPYYIRALFDSVQTIDAYWRGAPSFKNNVMTFASSRNPGKTYQMDPQAGTSKYYRSIAGDMSLTTVDVTGAPFADTSAHPDTFVNPGAAEIEVNGAPVYASAADAAAAYASLNPPPPPDTDPAGGEPDPTPTPEPPPAPDPIATLSSGTKLRVSQLDAAWDGTQLVRVTTFNNATTGWVLGTTTAPRDSRSPSVWSVSDGGALFWPNGDGNRDVYDLKVTLSEQTSWTLQIQRTNGTTLKSASGSGTLASILWDGKVSGTLQPDGTYRWRVTATDAWGNPPLVQTGTFILDHDPIFVTRLAGPDRYATAAAISTATFAPNAPVVYIANGQNFPDALAGAAAAGTKDAPLLLVPPTSIPSAIATELARLNPTNIVILGGPSVVSDQVASQMSFR